MKMWRLLLLAGILGIGILTSSCPGTTHVSVGVSTGPYPPYGYPYPGPPIWIGRPYPGPPIW